MSTQIPPGADMPMPQQPAAVPVVRVPETTHELKIYGHSSFLYWWPVWFAGYLIALLTRVEGTQITIGNNHEWFLLSQSAGVIYTVVFFLVIMITNVALRGLSSVIAILAILFLVVLFAYLGWWETIVKWLPHVSVHMNLGFYILFSTLIFVVWAGSVFIYDRMSYWIIRPGQITHEYVIGGAEKSYDTRGMVFEKIRNDLFRHWVLGFGSADLHIATMGAKRENLVVPNVLFADAKVQEIQHMIAVRPDQFTGPVV